jgi:GDP-L-fucose synthase
MREFLHVDDMAEACLFLMQNYNGKQFVNIGTGKDITIRELAETIMETVGYQGKLTFNTDKPDGTPRKLLDVSKINNLGWHHKIDLKEGIEKTYQDFMENVAE